MIVDIIKIIANDIKEKSHEKPMVESEQLKQLLMMSYRKSNKRAAS